MGHPAPNLSAAEIILLAGWCMLVAFAGGLLGLVLGNIRLPLVLLLSSSAASGGGANLAISGVAAAVAAAATGSQALA